ncbi:MAG: M15 family metallopeptidase [Dysgonamonadaceae bacterium]|jgi:D-alanyl-D-alanine dipeptidase|nr:M15 family metallopeptidase [Dysgonamonadaceae bacterium]
MQNCFIFGGSGKWFSRAMNLTILSLLLICAPFVCGAQDWDAILSERGFVDVTTLDTAIRVHLAYATPDNFMGKAVYVGLTKAWLHPDAAGKLAKAQQILRRERPGYALLVYDATRPIPIQRYMYNFVKEKNKTYYVANPDKKGGRHNYGMAVDLTIIDRDGQPLPMGTPFDFLSMEANTDKEDALVKNGKISKEERDNRLLLRRVMRQAGFTTVTSEWWHFNACSAQTAIAKYRLVE